MKLDTQYSLGASIKYQFTHTCVTVGKYKFCKKYTQLISKVHIFFDTSIPIHISIRTCHGVVGLVLTQ
jgi:hypothetical protein